MEANSIKCPRETSEGLSLSLEQIHQLQSTAAHSIEIDKEAELLEELIENLIKRPSNP